jgi:hypothetical protein
MGQKQRYGWALIALAGAFSIGIVGLEIFELMAVADNQTSETLPVLGFDPLLDE